MYRKFKTFILKEKEEKLLYSESREALLKAGINGPYVLCPNYADD